MSIFRSRNLKTGYHIPEDPLIPIVQNEEVVDDYGDVQILVTTQLKKRSDLVSNLPDFRGYDLNVLLKAGVQLEEVNVNLSSSDLCDQNEINSKVLESAVSQINSLKSNSSSDEEQKSE